MPEIQLGILDIIVFICVSVTSDSRAAIADGCFFKEFFGIIKFRLAQFTGSFRGNHDHRELSKKRKENYFFPTKTL